jgi:quercetin dioxygenase-like cupin family protein
MSPMSRALTGPNLTFDLPGLIEELRGDESYARTGRAGRTLAKDGSLRLTLVLIAKGVEVGTHHAESPMTLQPVKGRLHYRVGEEHFEIGAGEVLYFGPGHAQDIHAVDDTAILLTITCPEAGDDATS